jgi:hypothetical protein
MLLGFYKAYPEHAKYRIMFRRNRLGIRLVAVYTRINRRPQYVTLANPHRTKWYEKGLSTRLATR